MTKKFKEMLKNPPPPYHGTSTRFEHNHVARMVRWYEMVKIDGFTPKRSLSCPLGQRKPIKD